MSLDRSSRPASTDENDERELIEDLEYFHISEIYIKDTVNLKFDETTKVYINGVEQSKENMYVSSDRISVSSEKDVIIPEGYIAPAFLDETFEEEQRSALEEAILQLIKAGKATYSDDVIKEAVNEALENNGSIIPDFYISESITKSRRLYFFDEETVNALDKKITNNYKFAAYYEIAVILYVNHRFDGFINEISTPISITIPYPNGVPEVSNGYQRVWKIIRYHEGKVDILDAEKTSNGISFENDKFSAFALVYEDIKVNDVDDSQPKTDEISTAEEKPNETDKFNNPKTSDSIMIWISILVISILSSLFIIKHRSKKSLN